MEFSFLGKGRRKMANYWNYFKLLNLCCQKYFLFKMKDMFVEKVFNGGSSSNKRINREEEDFSDKKIE